MNLRTDVLERSLAQARHALPIVHDGTSLDALAAAIAEGRVTASLQSLESRWARARIDHNRPLLSIEGQRLIDEVDLYVVPHMYHNATATFQEDRRTIIIYRGLLDAIVYFSSINQFIVGLPTEFDDVFPLKSFPNWTVRSAVGVLLPILLVHFFRDMMALPPVFGSLNDEQKKVVIGTVDSALIFLVCHELGHFELGHLTLDVRPARTVICDLLFEESLTDYQREEIDADEFAIGLFQPELLGLAPGSILAALSPLSFFEPLLEWKSRSHPFSANRISHISRIGAEKAQELGMPKMEDHFIRMANSTKVMKIDLDKTRALGMDPFRAGLARVDVLEALHRVNHHLAGSSFDLTSVLEAVPPMAHERRSGVELFV
jgi:hypothetical protein